MYSRYPNYRFGGGIKIPENYSGNAFGRGLTFNDTDSEEEKEHLNLMYARDSSLSQDINFFFRALRKS